MRQRRELCGQGLHFRNSACISDPEEKSRLLSGLAATPREDKLTYLGCPEKRPHKGISIACCIPRKRCRDASSFFFFFLLLPLLLHWNWVSTKSVWSQIFWGEGNARVAIVYRGWVRGRCLPLSGRTLHSKWWRVSPVCFSSCAVLYTDASFLSFLLFRY